MPRSHPLLPVARLLCDLQPTLHLLSADDADSSTDEWVQASYDRIEVSIRKCEASLRAHHLYDELMAAFAASKALAKQRRVDEADVALLSITRTLLELAGQNDIWRKSLGFGHTTPTKQQ
jgi:hypothetical protein